MRAFKSDHIPQLPNNPALLNSPQSTQNLLVRLKMSPSTVSPGTTPLCVPGFGMPVDKDVNPTFPSALLADWWTFGVTVREKRMMAFINEVTDKPEWERKVFDEGIVAKWREEASARPEELNGDVVLSNEMFNFVGLLLFQFTLLIRY